MEVINEAAENKTDIDLKELWGCYTLDVIAKCCFAIDINSYKDPNNIFVQKVAELNQFRILPALAYFFIPDAVYKLLGFQRRNFQKFDYFVDLINHVINEREKSKTEHSDFLQMVIEAVKNDKEFINETNNSYDRDMVIAQSILFLIAGYETTALLLTFCSYVLATEPQIQEQLHNEISAIPSNEGIMDHEALMSAPYLNAFVLETLRCFPPGIRFERVSNEEYTIAEYGLTLPKDS
ncbi:cytochrome P450-like protein 4, partial [Leptotrombidium deliense]